MSGTTAYLFDRSPRLAPLYYRALFGRRGRLGRGETALPALRGEWRRVPVDGNVLAAYREVCGITESPYLPLLYPYVITQRIQLTLMSLPQFPLRLLGLVHHRNRVLQTRPIPCDAALDAACWIGGARPVKHGLEFDVHVHVRAGGELSWENISTYLARGSHHDGRALYEPPRLPELTEGETVAEWRTARDTARRYARVSGDYNPIHVSSILARLFGFPRAIVHGMWSAAACLAHLPCDSLEPIRCDFAFKGPIFPGSRVTLRSRRDDGACRFDLYCGGNERPSVCGLVYPADTLS